jgi:hypothetical protein
VVGGGRPRRTDLRDRHRHRASKRGHDLRLEAAAQSADGAAEPVASAPVAQPEPLLDLARAPSAEIDRAVERGIDGLEPLAEKYPEDPAVLRKLVHVRAADLQQAADVGSLHQAKRLFEIDETTTRDREIHPFLLRAANGPTEVAKVAMEIMAEHMGAQGPDLLYRLLTADGVGKFPKERAAELLASVEVKRRASPALAIALELRAITQPCARKPLLERAGMVGDERSRAYLRPLTLQHKCGFLGLDRCFAAARPPPIRPGWRSRRSTNESRSPEPSGNVEEGRSGWAQQDLNLRLRPCEGRTLPLSYAPAFLCDGEK